MTEAKNEKLKKVTEGAVKEISAAFRRFSTAGKEEPYAKEIQEIMNMLDTALQGITDPAEALNDIDDTVEFYQEAGKIQQVKAFKAELMKISAKFLVKGTRILAGLL